MNTALVTGIVEQSQAVAMALEAEGFDVCIWDRAARQTVQPLRETVDCYVSLPAPVSATGVSVRPVTAGAVVERLDTVSTVAPLLKPDAVVVLVTEQYDRSGRVPPEALRALGEAAVAQRVGHRARVAVLDSGDAGHIASVTRLEWNQARALSLADLAPDMEYADWRNEVISLTSSAGTTYFGWRRRDGSRRVAVLRRSVLSPLPGGEDGGQGLAWAILNDALGPSVAGELHQWDGSLAEDFLDDVVASLPDAGFELPMHDVAAWVVRKSLSLPD